MLDDDTQIEVQQMIDSAVMQAIKSHIHNGVLTQRVNLSDIFGHIQTVGALPTGAPQNIYGQFVIYNGLLYVYDFVNGVWDEVGQLPASPSTSVQFNNGGVFGGDAQFEFVTSTHTLTLGSSSNTQFNGKMKIPVGTNLYP